MRILIVLFIFCPICLYSQVINTIPGSSIYDPQQLTFDRFGNLYVPNGLGNQVYKIDTLGFVTLFAGNGSAGYLGDGGQATAAELNVVNAVVSDTFGNIYIACTGNNAIRKVNSSSGIITTIAGNGFGGYGGDGGPASAAFLYNPKGLWLDKYGSIYINDYSNYRIRKIDSSGIITTIAGTGVMGNTGDGGPATLAECQPYISICEDARGNVYFGDQAHSTIRKIDTLGIITTFAGDSLATYSDGWEFVSDGVPALGTGLTVGGMTFNSNGFLFFDDTYNNRVRVIDGGGIIHTVAGDGVYGFTGDGGNSDSAEIGYPSGLVFDRCGNLYISQIGPGCIRKVTFNPSVSALTGLLSVCQGASITLVDTSSGGTWSASNSNATISSVGAVIGIASGTDTITYSITNVCGTNYVTAVVTINPLPFVDSISGMNEICAGAVVTYTDTTTGGTWSLSNTDGSLTSGGVFTGLTGGIDTIFYAITNTCGTVYASKSVAIDPGIDTAVITGSTSICAGANDTLWASIAGGILSSSSGVLTSGPDTASIVVAGLVVGADTITYSIANACGTGIATTILTVNALPEAGAISGFPTYCLGAAYTLSDTVGSGSWSSSDSEIVSVSNSGAINCLYGSTATITYSLTAGGCSAYATTDVTVSSYPDAGVITGADTVCVGVMTTLTDTFSTGITQWIVTDSLLATVAAGTIMGLAAGTDTAIYRVTNSCGTGIAQKTITIQSSPNAGTIICPDSICTGATASLTDSVPGGTWRVSNALALLSGNTLTGVSTGNDTVYYSLSNACGTTTISQAIAIISIPTPGAISGPDSVCAGGVVLLTEESGGGVWSAINTNATIAPDGFVTGLSAGVDTIVYSLTNICGTGTVAAMLDVNPLPDAGVITGGSDTLCLGTYMVVAATAPGGAWNCSNALAVSSGDTIRGVTRGWDTVIYTVYNSCGAAIATKPVYVDSLPVVGAIENIPTFLCDGASTTLFDSTSGGTWSTTGDVTSIDSNGVVYGYYAGIDYISYAVSNSCGTSEVTAYIDVIEPIPSPIEGPDSVCVGSSIVLSADGSTWTSDSTIATITSSGVLTGIAAGIVNVVNLWSTPCGTAYTEKTVQVIGTPIAGSITNSSPQFCVGDTLTLTDAGATGVSEWLSTTGRTLISPPGTGQNHVAIVPVATGSDTMLDVVSNTCGADTALYPINISAKPAPPTVAGTTIVCYNRENDTLIYAPGDGAFTTTNGYVTVTHTGVVTAAAPGFVQDTIVYTLTNTCGSAADSFVITVPTKDSCDAINAVPQLTAQQGGIEVFPNPAQNELTIRSTQHLGSVRISDLVGKIVFSIHTDNTYSVTLPLGELPGGLYVVEIADTRGSVTISKFVKE